MREALKACIESLALPDAAQAFLLDVWDLTQVLDDWVDGDPVSRQEQDQAIWLALVRFPAQPFLTAHQGVLTPVLASMVLKWKAADTVERLKLADQLPKAYVWRAGFYDVVLQVVLIVHGPEVAMAAAHEVLGMYGETFTAYRAEFN